MKPRLLPFSSALLLIRSLLSGAASPSASSVPSIAPPTAAPTSAASTAPASPSPAAAVDLTIYGAASLKGALAAAKPIYEAANPGVTLTISTDASSALATQIEQGLPPMSSSG